ncbi:hypothetical protein [Leptospira stimsonii]|uniref:Uncharacterized protein n=1 Tax=Leptospira stimsonii TaxID=2202203 RepID=A0A396YPE2_9LEPT|nr:hypothetical protein [Leptospira stimsonii]RHX83407.1 hypothetical protein DLM75_23990 [Leptospira stimsonii]
MKKFILIIYTSIILNCIPRTAPSDEEVALDLLILKSASLDFQFKNRIDIGTLNVTIGEDKIILLPGEFSKVIFRKFTIKSLDYYKLESQANGLIIDNPNFDFSGSLKDGVLIKSDAHLLQGVCSLVNGETNSIEANGCE